MKKTLLAGLLSAMVSASAFADTSNYILINEYVKAGLNGSIGTLGSGGNTLPGLQYDNTGTGTFNDSYDYLTPGSAYEGWAVRIDNIDGSLYKLYGNNNDGWSNDGNTGVTGAWVGTPTASSAVWSGTTTEFDISHTYRLPSAQKFIDINTQLDAKVAMPHLYFGRYIDPDAVAAAGDSSSTDNVRGYGIIPKTNVVFSEATVSRYALGLYSASTTGVNTSIQSSWSSDPKTYYNNVSGYDVGNGDDTIGIAFYASNVAVGDILTWNYSYIFGPSAFAAASYAIDGGAGGGTAGTSSFGTLVDVGSATDAAESGSTGGGSTPDPDPEPPAPTVVSTSTATITVSDTTAPSTTLPVITASLAHHEASEANGKQTIARETTTNVTTPMIRTVVTLDRTTTTWSDGDTTTSDSDTTTTETLSNSVETSVANDSFSGRVDQMSELKNLNTQLDRSLNMDAFRQDGRSKDDITVYINGTGVQSNMSNGYDSKTSIGGIAVEKQIDSDWRLGAQYNKAHTKLNGVDSNTTQYKDHVGLYSVYNLEGATVVNNLGYAKDDISSNRTVEGVFNNSHKTTGENLWLNNRIYAPAVSDVRPFAGVTVGRSTLNGYTENGSIQSARTVAGQSNDYTYGEVGLRADKKFDNFVIAGEAGYTTDEVTTGNLTLGYQPTKDGMIAVTLSTQNYKGINSNSASIRGIIRF